MRLVRYCYECGTIGPVPEGARDCCPDGSHAVLVPKQVAEQARTGFELKLFVYDMKAMMSRYQRFLQEFGK